MEVFSAREPFNNVQAQQLAWTYKQTKLIVELVLERLLVKRIA